MKQIEKFFAADRVGLEVARFIVGHCARMFEPEPRLFEWWEGYSQVADDFEHKRPVCAGALTRMRLSLEHLEGLDEVGEHYIAASKMALSAVMLYIGNEHSDMLEIRDAIHDDIEPLLLKGLDLLDEVQASRITDEEKVPVRFADATHEELRHRKEQAQLRYLIDNAVTANG